MNTTDIQGMPTVYTIRGQNAVIGGLEQQTNEYTALTIPAFWSAVRFISETIAGMPRSIYQQTGTTRRAVDHPLNRVLNRRPNNYSTPFTQIETTVAHAVTYGNGYQLVQRDRNGTSLHILPPDHVTPFRYQGEQWYFVKASGRDAKDVVIPGSDVIHLRGLGFDGMQGYPLVQLLAESLDHARQVDRFGYKYLKKGTQIQGAIECPEGATNEQINQMLDLIRRKHSGLDANYDYVVLTGGAKLSNTTISPEQSQLIQSREASINDICMILRIPPHIVYQLGRATWNNIASLGVEVVKYSLRPWVEKLEQELTAKLLTDAEQDAGFYVHIAVDYLMRGDPDALRTSTIATVNGGLITPNEGRQILDYAPDPDPASDHLRVPVITTPAQPAASAAKPAIPAAPLPPEDDYSRQTAAPAVPAVTIETFRPLIADAIGRVEAKTTNAFARKEGKSAAELTIWGNVFSAEQSQYVADALAPVAKAMESMGLKLDTARIASRYGMAIKQKAAGIEAGTLAEIVESVIAGGNDEGTAK